MSDYERMLRREQHRAAIRDAHAREIPSVREANIAYDEQHGRIMGAAHPPESWQFRADGSLYKPDTHGYLKADNIDARAMLAREVYAEWQWREESFAMRPALFVRLELGGFNVRQYIESVTGENLV